MPVTTVGNVIKKAKLVLQEVTSAGTRWTNEELIGWLNESYQADVQVKPDAASINAKMQLVTGTRQTIPSAGHRLIDVIRNTSANSQGYGILVATRRSIDQTRRGWHNDSISYDIEQFMFDDLDPTHFYVYPPARSGAEVELIYSAVPTPHSAESGLAAVEGDLIKLPDAYAPCMLDYILYRAYSKDAGHAANLNRAQMHFSAFGNSLGIKAELDMANSPNAVDGSSNPQRANR
jgi:hypothetical protein